MRTATNDDLFCIPKTTAVLAESRAINIIYTNFEHTLYKYINEYFLY